MKVFLDANILIRLGHREPATEQAVAMLYALPRLELYTADLIRLEVIPKATFHQKRDEVTFYQMWFPRAIHVPITPVILARAEAIAIQYGLSALDAAHCAVAESVGATLLTQEKLDRPLHRVPLVKYLC